MGKKIDDMEKAVTEDLANIKSDLTLTKKAVFRKYTLDPPHQFPIDALTPYRSRVGPRYARRAFKKEQFEHTEA